MFARVSFKIISVLGFDKFPLQTILPAMIDAGKTVHGSFLLKHKLGAAMLADIVEAINAVLTSYKKQRLMPEITCKKIAGRRAVIRHASNHPDPAPHMCPFLILKFLTGISVARYLNLEKLRLGGFGGSFIARIGFRRRNVTFFHS